jgi:transposase
MFDALLGVLPVLGKLRRRRIAPLAAPASHARETCTWRAPRRIWGGRRGVREAVHTAALNASCQSRPRRHARPNARQGGALRTILIAAAKQLLVILTR